MAQNEGASGGLESEYITGSGYPNELKKVDKKLWGKAPAIQKGGRLIIQGRSTMELWQRGYMAEFAKVVTENGGRILELGFGLALSATAIQQYPIDEHVIVESNEDVFSDLEKFAKDAPHKVTPILGMWQDVIEDKGMFPDASFDGIFFDAAPFDERELQERPFDFGNHAYRLLKPNGIYTYCNLTGIGVLKHQYDSWDNLFRETQLPGLQKCGFNDIRFKLVEANPPKGDVKYQHKQAVIPIMIKTPSSASH